VILTSSTLPARLIVTGCFPTCLTVVGGFDPSLIFLLLNLSFLLLLIHQVTSFRTFTDEEDEMEGDLASEEGEEDLTGEEGEGST
jgi:hypothetical protein